MSHDIATPVKMMDVMTSRLVALRPKPLNIDIWFPALKFPCAGFDALDGVITREQSFTGIADGRVEDFVCAREDSGRGVVSIAVER
jgi:hypothetical protein